jgi:DNA-binding FrmR family transcriptional regulator
MNETTVMPDAAHDQAAHEDERGHADGHGAHDGPHGYISSKENYLKRLRRIEGQARGLQGMVSDEKYCIDILTQISAMTSALQSVALGLLDDHLSHCVVDAAAQGGPNAEAKIKEASDAIARLVRS